MLITAKQLSNIQFAHSYHWDIKFPSFSGDLFPAKTVTDTMWNFKNETINYGPAEFHYPSSAQIGGLSVQIIETDKWEIVSWLEEWRQSVFDPSDFTVGLVGDPNVAREVELYNQDWQKNPVLTRILLVIPSSEISVEKSSSKGDTINISLNFNTVGEKG